MDFDELKKGFYSLFSSSESNGLGRHNKKGSEIKQGISNLLSNTKDRKKEALDKMTSEKVSFAPDTYPSFNMEYKHLLDYVPKKFSYDLIYHGEKYVKTDNGIEEQAVRTPTQEEQQSMREYNKYAEMYVELCIDAIKLETLQRNIDDKKTYSLSIDQMTLLGL